MDSQGVDLRGVDIREVRALRQHNLHAYFPVLRVVMDVGEYDDRPSNGFPGFVDRLTAWLPGLHQHECSVGRPGGFIERLNRGTYLPHICEHVTIELQNLMGFDVTYGRARGTGERGVYSVVIAYEEEEPARAAFDTALRLTLAAMHDQPFDAPAEVERLLELADEYRLGPSTAAIVSAARRRGIPVTRLTPTSSLVQLGYGKFQKRIVASETSNTSAIAVELCQEKPMTNRLLRSVGVPVPEGEVVRSADDAWRVARDVGLPVVLKPEAGNQGKGVSVNLRNEAEVRRAYDVAAAYDPRVLVERHVQGVDYRLLVVNGKMVAAARREPAQVVGDGVHTVEQLVAIVNKDPRRRPGHSNPLTQITLGEAADLVLAQQGYDRQFVPLPGQVVRLRTNANLSTGGTATDVTDEVHPRNARLAELAAQFLALDVAGIDVICHDIRRPLDGQGGAVVEVNAAPGLRMHLHPTAGKPRRVGRPIVDMLYPDGAPSRIPIVAITGTNGKTTVGRLVAHVFETARKVVGRTSTEGVYIDDRRIVAGDCSGPKSAQAVLLHPHVEVAVLETARGGILREGLGYDGCDVAVVTNVSNDHLGQKGIETVEDLAKVKQVVVEAVDRDGATVLNADDPLVAEMSAASDAPVIYFTRDTANPVVAAHLADGGRCVSATEGAIVLHAGGTATELLRLTRVPFTRGGRVGFQVANALAAVAACWGAGVNPALIARALSTFKQDVQTVPGRFNVMDVGGVEVVLDYAHNEAAMHALAEAVQGLGKRRTVMVIGLPGDRRDRDLVATISATVPVVDQYVLHDLGDRRERAVNEVPELLKARLPANVPVEIVADQRAGISHAWRALRPGDRLVVIADVVDEALDALRALQGPADEDAACESPVAPAGLFADDDGHAATASERAHAAGRGNGYRH
ncbi:MAG TPA: cyanophycin synthetase [Tepidisphaeraceae bacterium]|nr:cyanophycin synthetase [Tepidisphaeraceae bacterium]